MPLDSDRCHFCGKWTKDYTKIGDRAVCEKCFAELVKKIGEKL
ncbi:MAG: hypothetical protein R6U61_03825 [Thermoplasmata archaeon]